MNQSGAGSRYVAACQLKLEMSHCWIILLSSFFAMDTWALLRRIGMHIRPAIEGQLCQGVGVRHRPSERFTRCVIVWSIGPSCLLWSSV